MRDMKKYFSYTITTKWTDKCIVTQLGNTSAALAAQYVSVLMLHLVFLEQTQKKYSANQVSYFNQKPLELSDFFNSSEL